MSGYHPNTLKLIRIGDNAIELGWYKKHPNTCFCEEVARRAKELGNEYPSDEAIRIAERMLNQLKRRNETQ